jgi:hypothetical protein
MSKIHPFFVLLLAITLGFIGVAAQPKAIAPHGLTIYATGQDQTAALQSLYNNATDGDTLMLRPLNGVKRFVVASALNWTGTKSIHVDAVGVEIATSMTISGTQAMITWGAPVGQRAGNLVWRGGAIMGSIALQNVSYSRFEPQSCDCVILQADQMCSYNRFCYPGGGSGGSGNGSAIIANQLTDSAWMDENKWHDTPLGCRYGLPCIQQASKTATGPFNLKFFGCSFESDGAMIQVYNNTGLTFRDCYFEGAWTAGTKGPSCSIQVVNSAHSPWTDPSICPYDVNE